ncbi:AsmA family protein [Vibrio proteolyticus]
MKKIVLFIAALLLIVVIGLAALVLLVNPNQFKPLIVEQAKKHTGLELVIEGDISWQFFPSLGFELGKTELRNPAGFTKPNMLKVESVGIDVSVMPLLSKQLEIGNVTLDGAEFNLETLKDGRKNIDALSKAQTAQTESKAAESNTQTAPETNDQTGEAAQWTIHLAGVTVSNATLDIQDKQAGTFTKLYDVSLNLSEFAVDTWTKADFAAKGENNQQTFGAKGNAEFKLAPGFKEYALRNIKVDANFSDASNQIESAKLELATFEFDKANTLTYAVKGKTGDMALDLNGSGALKVNKAITQVSVSKLMLAGQLEGAGLPQSPMKVAMTSDVNFDLNKSHLSVILETLTANAIALDGKADVTLGDIPKVRFTLHSPNIDLDEFLGLESTNTESKPATSGGNNSGAKSGTATSAPEQEPDLSALKTLDVQGGITIDKFKASNAKMQNVKASFTVDRGVAKLTSFRSQLYGGAVNATATLDARKTPATYAVKKQIKGVQVQPLLKDVADNDKLEGTGNIDVNVQGRSLTPSGIKKNLAGTVVIKFADGAVNGINVAQMIRDGYAKFKGKSIDGKEGAQKTDFSAMGATLNLSQGVVSTKDLTMQSPLLRIGGEGKANYINETVDFLVRTSIVGTLEGQGGKDINELRDLTIPINVSGKWEKPKFKLVFDDVLKQKAQKELDRNLEKLDEKLGDKIKDEKTKDAINNAIKGLFN